MSQQADAGGAGDGLRPGLTSVMRRVVDEQLTAHHYGNKGFHVLATPALAWLFEMVSTDAVLPYLQPGDGTVGSRLELRHLAPTPVGMAFTIGATLAEVEGRRLLFQIVARDEVQVVAEGSHERYIVNLERFLRRTQSKRA